MENNKSLVIMNWFLIFITVVLTVSFFNYNNSMNEQFEVHEDAIKKLYNDNTEYYVELSNELDDLMQNQDRVGDNNEVFYHSLKDKCDNNNVKVTDMMFIEAARERYMQEHNWTPGTDCSVLTQQFTMLLKEFDIEMYKVYAWYNDTNVGHAYNCIPYDVQSGLQNGTWDRYDMMTNNRRVSYR